MGVMHIVAEPVTIHGKPIDVHWDEEAGTVTGQGARHIMKLATWGRFLAVILGLHHTS